MAQAQAVEVLQSGQFHWQAAGWVQPHVMVEGQIQLLQSHELGHTRRELLQANIHQ
jgi:hypothetical protein